EIFNRQPTLAQVKKMKRMPLFALIENIRSMYNVGSIFRSSDAINLSKLYLSGFTAKPPRKEIDKTALGATESVPWEYIKDPIQLIDELKNNKVEIVVVEHTDKSVNYADVQYNFPVCFIFGNEVEGVSDDIVVRADKVVELPMLGIKHSLNVAVAYGIIMYNALNQYRKSKA
ncbi:MAG: TrmH family RNA methyltransferase, partial [Calditrichaceae bacterium]